MGKKSKKSKKSKKINIEDDGVKVTFTVDNKKCTIPYSLIKSVLMYHDIDISSTIFDMICHEMGDDFCLFEDDIKDKIDKMSMVVSNEN